MKNNVLKWAELRKRRDLEGCVVEIFTAFSPDPHPRHLGFIRGILTDIDWKDGRPATIRFKDAWQYVVNGRSRQWLKHHGMCFACNRRNRFPQNITDRRHPARKNAYVLDGIIKFYSLDLDSIALFPGCTEEIRQRPYFFTTAKQDMVEWAKMVKMANEVHKAIVRKSEALVSGKA